MRCIFCGGPVIISENDELARHIDGSNILFICKVYTHSFTDKYIKEKFKKEVSINE